MIELKRIGGRKEGREEERKREIERGREGGKGEEQRKKRKEKREKTDDRIKANWQKINKQLMTLDEDYTGILPTFCDLKN